MFNINEGGLLFYIFRDGISEAWHYYAAYISFVLITILAAYLFGSINSAIIISKSLYGDDIRKYGSGNAGMTNMLRTYGLGAAGLTLLGDILKTVFAIVVAGVLFGFGYAGAISTTPECYIAGLFTVMGHIFPLYYGFKGGKGVLATATVALVLSPVPFALLITVFVIMVWASKYVSLGSVTGAVLYPVAVNGYFIVMFGQHSTPGIISLTTIFIAVIIVWKHWGNLQRISNRTERKISFKKKEKEVIESPESTSSVEEKDDKED